MGWTRAGEKRLTGGIEADFIAVLDAQADERFAANPLVTAEPHVQFYAGVPLNAPDGHALGTVCVIDHLPRALAPNQIEALEILGRQVIAQLELRRHVTQLEHVVADQTETEQQLR